MTKPAIIRFYAVARREDGKLAQVLVTRTASGPLSTEWTGVTYRTEREASADMRRLNCGSK